MAFFVVSLMGPFQNECEKTYCNSFAFRNRSMDCAHAVGGQCAIVIFSRWCQGKNIGDIRSCLLGADPTSLPVDFVCFRLVFFSRLPFWFDLSRQDRRYLTESTRRFHKQNEKLSSRLKMFEISFRNVKSVFSVQHRSYCWGGKTCWKESKFKVFLGNSIRVTNSRSFWNSLKFKQWVIHGCYDGSMCQFATRDCR